MEPATLDSLGTARGSGRPSTSCQRRGAWAKGTGDSYGGGSEVLRNVTWGVILAEGGYLRATTLQHHSVPWEASCVSPAARGRTGLAPR